MNSKKRRASTRQAKIKLANIEEEDKYSEISTLKREYITNLHSSNPSSQISSCPFQESTIDTLSTRTFDENSSTLSEIKFSSKLIKRKMKELKEINEYNSRSKQTLHEIITSTKTKTQAEVLMNYF